MEKEQVTVPYIVHESSIARMERANKRLVIALVIAVLTIFASNATWLYVWNQYDYVGDSEDNTIETRDGTANYIGNDGDIVNGPDSRSTED